MISKSELITGLCPPCAIAWWKAKSFSTRSSVSNFSSNSISVFSIFSKSSSVRFDAHSLQTSISNRTRTYTKLEKSYLLIFKASVIMVSNWSLENSETTVPLWGYVFTIPYNSIFCKASRTWERLTFSSSDNFRSDGRRSPGRIWRSAICFFMCSMTSLTGCEFTSSFIRYKNFKRFSFLIRV